MEGSGWKKYFPRGFDLEVVVRRSAAIITLPAIIYAFAFGKAGGDTTEVRTVIPGAAYETGWLHQLFFGSHWRSLWASPIEVPVLNLHSYAGGLTPLKQGGGMQTKSLRLLGADGRHYKFRSIDKDPEKILPEKLRKTLANDILQDQISSANPLAAIVVAPLLNGVGILNAEPSLVVLPDDSGLGEFREEFRGMFGTIEEHPNEGQDGELVFAGADKVISTYTLFEKMEEDFHHRVDEHEYLKARLMDIFLGDWDRHTDQWRWAGFERDGWWIWKPIPRDRDQAFARFDGIFPWAADVVVPMLGLESVAQLSHFGDEYPSIEDLTWTGRFLDRRLMNSVTTADWDSVTLWLRKSLSDSLLEAAVQRLPPASYKAGGQELLKSLKSRRTALPEASEQFYGLLTKHPDLRGSDKPEVVHIWRRNDGNVEVSFFERDDQSGGARGKAFFHRVFDSRSTDEIRIYLLDGNDRAVVLGEVDESIPVYVDGGKGTDEFFDSSWVTGSFLALTKQTATVFFVDGDEMWTAGPGTSIKKQYWPPKPRNKEERWEPPLKDYGGSWRIGTIVGASPDEGLFIGGGPVSTKYGFHQTPFVHRFDIRAGYATHARKFRAAASVEIPVTNGGMRFLLRGRISQLEVLNYFGFGNETRFNKTLVDAGYFKVRQQHLALSQSLEWPIAPHLEVQIGGTLKFVDTDPSSFSLLGTERPYGSSNLSQLSIDTRLTYDSRDSRLVPSRGWFGEVKAAYTPTVFNLKEDFGRLGAEFRGYVPLPALKTSVLALRFSGEGLAGNFPFFEAAFLGGLETLRGFEKQRFAGHAAVVGSSEIRVPVADFMILVPMTAGISVSGETGRVFLRGERSSRWHSSYGGGLWISFVEPEATLSLSLAQSAELTGLYFRVGFMF